MTAARVGLALALAAALGCNERRRPIAVHGDGAPAVEVVDPTKQPRANVPLVDEAEPNEDRAHAQPLEAGKGIRGTMHAPTVLRGKPAGDDDWYSLVAGGTPRDGGFDELRAELSGVAGLDLTLEALDGDGRRLWLVNDGGPGEGEVIANLAVEPGHTYYLRVREAVGAGHPPKGDPAHPYQLVVTSAAAPAGAEREPNDDAAHPSPAVALGDWSGFYGRRRDEDWLALPLAGVPAEGGAATLRLELGPVDGVAPLVRVVSGARVLAEARAGRGEELRLRNVGVPIGATAPALVLVKAAEGRSIEQRWALHVAAEPPLDGAEREPNNVPAEANPLPLANNAAQVSGFLWPGDVDVYKLAGAAPDALVTVEVEGLDRVDLRLERLGADGRVLVRADDHGAGQGEALPPWPLGDGLVRVSARPRDVAFDAPYRLTVSAAAAAPDEEREPNDDAAHATPWPAGLGPLRGRLQPRGDVDWYVFTAAASGKLRAVCNGGPQASVRLLGEQKTPLSPADQAAAGVVEAGHRYYVMVKAANPKAVAAEPYTLTLQAE